MRLKLFFAPVFLVFFFSAGFACAADYVVDYAQSRVAFSGAHAGNNFDATFEEWTAEINFDPDDLENSAVRASFNLASANSGNKMYDGTLPQADWFDVSNHPQGMFDSTGFSRNEDGSYHVAGALTLRGITHPVAFDFTLSDFGAGPSTMTARFPIDRLLYDIGKKSDAAAEWVDREIVVNLTLVATPMGGDL